MLSLKVCETPIAFNNNSNTIHTRKNRTPIREFTIPSRKYAPNLFQNPA
jgi:hypothetical protein